MKTNVQHYGLTPTTPKDYAEAVKWWRKAAEQGHALAQSALGDMYCIGEGVPENYAEAVKWYRKAAEQGDAVGQYNLGMMYSLGSGVQKDMAQATKWIRKAAEQGLSLIHPSEPTTHT